MSVPSQNDPVQAREFYRGQLRLSFCHSSMLSPFLTGVAQSVVDSAEFDGVLAECPFGSLECARRLGEMAVVCLDRAVLEHRLPPIPWWRDLLIYERAWFLQAATTEAGPPTNRPRRGVSALCTNFSWDLPEIVKQLKAGAEIAAGQCKRPVTLLFARDTDANVRMVEVGSAVEKVFRAANGLRTLEAIAATAGVRPADTRQILEALAGIGAIISAMSPEEMARKKNVSHSSVVSS